MRLLWLSVLSVIALSACGVRTAPSPGPTNPPSGASPAATSSSPPKPRSEVTPFPS